MHNAHNCNRSANWRFINRAANQHESTVPFLEECDNRTCLENYKISNHECEEYLASIQYCVVQIIEEVSYHQAGSELALYKVAFFPMRCYLHRNTSCETEPRLPRLIFVTVICVSCETQKIVVSQSFHWVIPRMCQTWKGIVNGSEGT